MSGQDTYEVFAIRYGRKVDRRRHENFIVAEPHDGLMPMDYYIWAIRNGSRTIVVDTGFDEAEARRRGREPLRRPREGLAMLGIDARQVADVVITHLHYDHAGTLDDFPQATFHVQDREMAYATGRHMRHEAMRSPYAPAHVVRMVEKVYGGQVQFHDGDDEIAPGVSVHHIGGHTMGLQCVRVRTRYGWVVLASDASHYYENMETGSPFPIVYSVGDMLEGYRKLRQLAGSDGHVIPGHDPLVLERYPAPARDVEGVIARLDTAPEGER